MRSGSMRHTASVYVKSDTPDEYGSRTSTLVLLGTFKCSKKAKYFQERPEDGQPLSRVRYELRFRHRPQLESLSPDSEIVIGSQTLVVMTVADPHGRERELWVLAEERQ